MSHNNTSMLLVHISGGSRLSIPNVGVVSQYFIVALAQSTELCGTFFSKTLEPPLHIYTFVVGFAIIILTIIRIEQFSENCIHFLVYNIKPQGDSCSFKVKSLKCEWCDWLMSMSLWLKGIHSVANHCQHEQVTFYSKHTYSWKVRKENGTIEWKRPLIQHVVFWCKDTGKCDYLWLACVTDVTDQCLWL